MCRSRRHTSFEGRREYFKREQYVQKEESKNSSKHPKDFEVPFGTSYRNASETADEFY